jgi:uncharacterized protein YndB with AHSA1/START domain
MTTEPPRAARAVADVTAGAILATVDIAAPPERVFRAISTDEIVQWWGSDDEYRTTAYTADLRVGGRWRSEGMGKQGPFAVEGEFVEIDPPRRLVQTWRAPWDGGNTTTITYRLDPLDGGTGTRLVLRHEGFADRAASCDGHAQGWTRVLGWLERHITPRPPRFFFIRLIVPRPTFMQDMSADERAVMGRHAAYWRGHLDAGTAIVFGPVADPKGAWGLGVVRAADEGAVRAFEAADPAVRELGSHYEVLPMARAVYRE